MGTVIVSHPFLVKSSVSAAIGAITAERMRAAYHGIGDIVIKTGLVQINEVTAIPTQPSTDFTPSIIFPCSLCLPQFLPTMAATASPGSQAIIAAMAIYLCSAPSLPQNTAARTEKSCSESDGESEEQRNGDLLGGQLDLAVLFGALL